MNTSTQLNVNDLLSKAEISALLKGMSETGSSPMLSYDVIERTLSEPEVARLLVQLTDQSIPLHRWKEIVHDFVRVIVSTINN
jgi:flagellar biosynthesis component FlhA